MTATRRQTRRAKRLRSIKDAALELVVEDGLDGFSVHKLADRVDLTAGALYRYFESRDDMLMAVQAEVLNVFDRYLAQVVSGASDRPILSQVVTICRAYVALADLQPQRFVLIAQLVAAPAQVFDQERIEPTADRTLAMLGRLADLIAQAEASEQLNTGNSAQRAVIAWASIHGLVERRKLVRLQPETFDPSSLMDELLTTLLVGWGASLEAAREAVEQPISNPDFRDAMQRAQAQQEEE